MPQTHPDVTLSLTHNDNQHIIQLHHETFQYTIVASASFTAVLFATGKPYTFGLNHRGQCGIGSFTPNVLTPSPVVGLASLRFASDYNSIIREKQDAKEEPDKPSLGSHAYQQCTVQECFLAFATWDCLGFDGTNLLLG
jgi:alpha-tubulin suppressor-like RCC1 family protein